jgi:hypothetical protein
MALFLGSTVAFAADSSVSPSDVAPRGDVVSQSPAVSRDDLDRWVRLWQTRLALDEWKIEARIVRQNELNPDTLGNLKWNSLHHTANLKVLDPRDYDMPAEQIPQDMERTVVHELVHLELSVLPRNGSAKVEERVVDRITEALLGLDRGENYAARVAAGQAQPKIRHADAADGAASRAK